MQKLLFALVSNDDFTELPLHWLQNTVQLTCNLCSHLADLLSTFVDQFKCLAPILECSRLKFVGNGCEFIERHEF